MNDAAACLITVVQYTRCDNAAEFQCIKLASAANEGKWRAKPARLHSAARSAAQAEDGAGAFRGLTQNQGHARLPGYPLLPHGPRDMLDHPARHAIYQRAREIERLSAVPQSVRTGQYLNQSVRRVSDDVARVAVFPMDNADLAKVLQDKQREMSRFRQMIAHVAESGNSASVSTAPLRRQARKTG